MSEQRVEVKFLKGPLKKKLDARYGKSVQINRKVYQLVWSESILVDSVGVAGLCDSENLKLYIDPQVDSVETTLLHEVGHSEIAESGVRQCPGWTRDIEELVVETISQGFAHNFTFKRKA